MLICHLQPAKVCSFCIHSPDRRHTPWQTGLESELLSGPKSNKFTSGFWVVQRGQEQGAGTGQLPAGPRIPPVCLPQEAHPGGLIQWSFHSWTWGAGAGTDASSNVVIYFSPGLKVWHREAVC